MPRQNSGRVLSFTPLTMLQVSAQAIDFKSVRHFGEGVEKVLKGFIEQRGKTFENIHNLAKLAGVAVSAGLPPPDAQLLAGIQCKADVRYSARAVGKAEVLEAHYAALVVCADVALRLEPQSGWRTQVRAISYLVDGKPRPMGALVVSRLKPR